MDLTSLAMTSSLIYAECTMITPTESKTTLQVNIHHQGVLFICPAKVVNYKDKQESSLWYQCCTDQWVISCCINVGHSSTHIVRTHWIFVPGYLCSQDPDPSHLWTFLTARSRTRVEAMAKDISTFLLHWSSSAQCILIGTWQAVFFVLLTWENSKDWVYVSAIM